MGVREKNKNNLAKRIATLASNFIYVALILIPFVSSFSSAGANIFIGISIFAYLLKKIAKKELGPKENAINIPFLLIVIVSLISFINSVDFKSSWGGIGKLATFGTLFMILAEEVRDRKHLKRIIIALILGLYLVSLDGAFQLYFGKDFLRNNPYDFVINLPRLRGTFPHTNIFAGYLTLLIPLSLVLTLYYLKGRRRLLLGLMTALSVFCLIFTFSRSAIFGFIVSLIFMGMIKRDKLIIGLVIIFSLLAPILLPQSIKTWVKSTDSFAEVLLNKERFNLYRTSAKMIRAHPVIGIGVNTYILNYQRYRVKDEVGNMGSSNYYAHNIYLHMASEIGLLGLSLFIWLLFAFYASWARFYRSAPDAFLKICSLGIIAGTIAFLINGLTETNLYYPKVATLFWYQVGLFMGISRINQEVK